jgi:two-component system sensor histidine kinase MprB
VAIVAVVAVAYVAVRHELLADLDKQLRHQATEVHVQKGFTQTLTQVVPFVSISTQLGEVGGYCQAIDAAGNWATHGPHLPISSHDVSIAAHGGTSLRDVNVNGVHVRMLTEPLPTAGQGIAVQLALPLTAVDHQLHKVATALLFLVLAGLAMATGGSWFVVRRTMRPVATLTEAA